MSDSQTFEEFFNRSPLAQHVQLTPQVILMQETLTQESLEAQYQPGKTRRLETLGHRCRLKVGDQEVAQGYLVKKGKAWYFQVLEVKL